MLLFISIYVLWILSFEKIIYSFGSDVCICKDPKIIMGVYVADRHTYFHKKTFTGMVVTAL